MSKTVKRIVWLILAVAIMLAATMCFTAGRTTEAKAEEPEEEVIYYEEFTVDLESEDGIALQGLGTRLTFALVANGDGTVSAAVKNVFTLGYSTVTIYLYLYSSINHYESYEQMAIMATNYTYDLNINKTLTATASTRGQARYWCAQMEYNIDNSGWSTKTSPIIAMDADGNEIK